MSPSSQRDEIYCFRLYIAGTSEPRSIRAVDNFHRLAERISGDCDLDVIDIYEQLEQAEMDRISATPTLVKVSPPPIQRFVGDLSDGDRVLAMLRIKRDR